MEKQLKQSARDIPMKAFRNVLRGFKSRKKSDFIEELYDRNPKKLEALAAYHTANKEKSFYLYRIRADTLSKDLSSEKIESKLKGLKHFDEDNDIIYEAKNVVCNPNKGEIYITIKVHSEVRTLYGEKPDTLINFSEDYRKGYTIYFIVHTKDKCFECRTRSDEKAITGSSFLSNRLYGKPDILERIHINKQQQMKLDKEIKAKKATISNIRFSGTEQIVLTGENVEKTIETFKGHDIDFDKMGALIQLSNTESTKQPIKFSSNGKISIKAKKIKDPYGLIRTVLFDNEKG